MNFALLYIVSVPALGLPPCVTRAAPAAAEVTTYDAFVATEETPALKDLKHPAIMNRTGREKAIVAPVVPASIA